MAQDVITKQDGSTIVAKVLKISSHTVEYKKYGNIDGPVYTLPLTTVASIAYENGTKETFNNSAVSVAPSTSMSDSELLASYYRLGDEKYQRRSKRCKIAAWAGLGAFLLTDIIFVASSDMSSVSGNRPIAIGIGAAGIVWCGSFLWAAHWNSKKAQPIYDVSSLSMIEHDVIKSKNSTMTANLNIIRDYSFNNNALGLGCRITF